jgi:Uma2 family endonuclease
LKDMAQTSARIQSFHQFEGLRERRYLREPRRIDFPVEETVPENKRHLELRTLLYEVLKLAFGDRAAIGSDQFVYWNAADPRECLAPDVFVRLGVQDCYFDSWKVWERGAPELAVEIISRSDSGEALWNVKLERYHRLGVRELVLFDPDDDERPLRLWDYVDGDLVERLVENARSAQCDALELWWLAIPAADLGLTLRLSRDVEGTLLLPTPTEAEASARRSAEERFRSAEERVRELETELERLRIRRD